MSTLSERVAYGRALWAGMLASQKGQYYDANPWPNPQNKLDMLCSAAWALGWLRGERIVFTGENHD